MRGDQAIGEVLQLHLLHELLVAGLVHQLEQPAVLRVTERGLVELQRGVVGAARLELALRRRALPRALRAEGRLLTSAVEEYVASGSPSSTSDRDG